MKQLRPRFSLLNLLLLMAIIALSFTVYRLNSEVGPLRDENKRLNNERGTLVIDDETKIHAIRVPTRFAGNNGTFRVFIPEGKKYLAIVAVNDIPKSGFPEVPNRSTVETSSMILGQSGPNAFAELPAGENQISLTIERRSNGSRYVRFATNSQGYPLDMTVQIPKGAWPEQELPLPIAIHGDRVPSIAQSFPPDKPIVLIQHRLEATSQESMNVSYVMPEPDYPLDGMMLWIEPIED